MRVDDADVKDEEELVRIGRTRRALTVARTKWLVVERLSIELTLKECLPTGCFFRRTCYGGSSILGIVPGSRSCRRISTEIYSKRAVCAVSMPAQL